MSRETRSSVMSALRMAQDPGTRNRTGPLAVDEPARRSCLRRTLEGRADVRIGDPAPRQRAGSYPPDSQSWSTPRWRAMGQHLHRWWAWAYMLWWGQVPSTQARPSAIACEGERQSRAGGALHHEPGGAGLGHLGRGTASRRGLRDPADAGTHPGP